MSRSVISISLGVMMLCSVVAVPALGQVQDFCSTAEDYAQNQMMRYGAMYAECDNGPCDDPANRDAAIPGPSDPIKYIRLYFHIVCEDDGSNCATTPEALADQVDALNADYLPLRIQFVYDYGYIHFTAFRYYPHVEAMKLWHAVDPDQQMNIYVSEYDPPGSRGTFPWDDVRLPLSYNGGITLHLDHMYPAPYNDNVLTHEVGHTLGLWHTHHGGSSEVKQCLECWEGADGQNGNTTGDLCADTPPTPKHTACSDPGTTDPCTGLPWGDIDEANYMSYASQDGSTCWTHFSSQQWGRIHCWSDAVLSGWYVDVSDPAIVSVDPSQHAQDVAPASTVAVVFDTDMNPATINSSTFKVSGSHSAERSGTYTYDGATDEATFTPAGSFLAGEQVTSLLTTGIESEFGTTLQESFAWTFRIGVAGGSGVFDSYATYGARNTPNSVCAADLDADGDIDLAVSSQYADSISVLFNNGSGSFPVQVHYGGADDPISVRAIDLDGDGDPDLATANMIGDDVAVWFNDGSGAFGTAQLYPVDNHPVSLRAADLDGDGDADLAVAQLYAGTVSVLLNNGTGVFAPYVSYGVGGGPTQLVPADLDRDGDLDLATANQYTDDISVLVNNGNGTFASAASFPTANNPGRLCSADLDSDGDLDIAAVHFYDNLVSVLFNDGSASFGPHTAIQVGDGPRSIVAGDFDNDLDLDLATANHYAAGVSILTNTGTGAFLPRCDFSAAGYGNRSVCAADLDGDQDLDLVTANWGTDDVSVLLNPNPVTASAPTLVSPANASSTTDHTPRLDWNGIACEGVDRYEVWVDNNSDFSSPTYQASNLTLTQWTTPYLASGWWYWRVRGHNPAGWGTWSPAWSVRTTTGGGCPVLYAFDGSKFVKENPLLTACEKTGHTVDVTDYYLVSTQVMPRGRQVIFQLEESAAEVTYLRDLELLTVDYPAHSNVGLTVDGQICAYEEYLYPTAAVDHTGRDCLGAVRDLDGIVYRAHTPGYLVVTFPNDPEHRRGFQVTAARKPDIIVSPKAGPGLQQLASHLEIELLVDNDTWVPFADVAPRDIPGQEFVISDLYQGLPGDEITLRLSWQKSYTTDAVLGFSASASEPTVQHVPVSTCQVARALTYAEDLGDLKGTLPLVLRRGDRATFGFDASPLDQGHLRRAYIVKAVGRFEPEAGLAAANVPLDFRLYNNFPNPFNPATTLSFDLPAASRVTLSVFNILGQRVSTLVAGQLEAGRHEFVWDARDESGRRVASGVYLYRIEADGYSVTRKMMLLE